jgi:pimeloyl-ACP methyl ester carboxylesterase
MQEISDCVAGVDFIDAGAGPLVLLVHSSMAGARQWSALSQSLQHRSLVRAVNLFGYGQTPAWSDATPPSLDDYADLLAAAVPNSAGQISIVGHSFGAAIAMQAAAHQLKERVKNLVLIEPSLFYLLDCSEHWEAFCEITSLAAYTKRCIANGMPQTAAARFIDYWCGAGTWAGNSPEKRAALTRLVGLLPHEWNAILEGDTTLAEWRAALPQSTLVISAGKTRRPSRALVDLLVQMRPDWECTTIGDADHMVPLTHPHLVNPIIQGFLTEPQPAMAE